MKPKKVNNCGIYITKHPNFTGCLINKIVKNKAWYKEGKWHREDGPAVEWADGFKAWYLNNIRYSEQDYKIAMRKIKLEIVLKRLDNENNTL